MGLLGNVAEVPDLRQKLMTKAFVAEFAMLLDSSLDGIEVRRNGRPPPPPYRGGDSDMKECPKQ